jgi:hypothetical protein
MDTTTLTLAVDSTQVNNASAALQRMAAEGYKAETVTAKLANTAALQGRALNTGIVKNATAAADSIKSLAGATTSLAGVQDFSKTTSSLAAAAAQARAATAEVRAFSAAVASVGAGSGVSFAVPKSSTAQQIAQAPVSVAARNIIGNASQYAVRAPAQIDAAASVRELATAARELDAKEVGAVNNALATTAAKAADATKSVSALDAALAATKPTNAGLDSISAVAKAQRQTAIPGATTALGNVVSKENNQAAAFPPVSAETSKSIDQYIKQLQIEQAVLGKTAREAELYKLALRGATLEQLKSADASLKLTEAYQKGEAIGGKIKVGLLAVAAAGVAAGVGLVHSVKGAIDAADHLNDLSKKTGIAVDTLGGLGFAASQAGGDLESISSAAGKLNKSIAQAGRGNKEFVATFGAIGINFRDAAGNLKSADVVLAELADKFAGYEDGANKSAIATKLLGNAGASLIGMLNDGGKGIRENVEYYKRYGGVTQEVADKSDQFNDTLGKLHLLSGAYSRTIAADLLPALQSVADEMLRSKENGTGLISFIHSLAESVNELTASLITGAKEAGGFWNAIFIGGTVNPFKSLQSNISGYREELRLANADLERFKKEGKDTGPIEASIRRTTARLNIVQGQADREAVAANGPGRQDPRKFDDRIKPSKKPDAPSIPKVGGRGNNEAAQILREQLADDLSAIKATLDAEKQALAFQQKYVQGVYQAGGISLKEFYDSKRETIAEGVAAELAELDKEIARLEQYKKQISDPSEKVKTQKQINQVGAQKEKLSTAAARDVITANQEEAASFKQLNDQLDNYRANLLQAQGDELGAARIRAQMAVDNARILAAQGAKDADGGSVKIDVDAYARQLELTNLFADAQRKASDIAQNTARAEEAANLAAEVGGKSLLETENAVYAVRSRAVDQLGILATKARELAEASTDPKIKQFAADLALQYAKAADAVDPALQRLREGQKELASGITNTLNNGVATLGDTYSKRRQDADKEVKDEKDRYDKRIEIQEGYLAQASRLADRERIKKKIADLEAQRDGVKGESKGKSLLQAINTNIITPIAQQTFTTVNKLLVTDPLQKYLEGQFKSLTEGDGLLAGVFKGAMGIKDPKLDANGAILAQAQAANASATALDVLTNAANSAAGALGNPNSKPLNVEPGSRQAAPSFGDFARADRALGDGSTVTDPAAVQAQNEARAAVDSFDNSTTSAASDVAKLAQAAGKGGGALSILPSLLNMISSAAATFTASMAASSAGSSGSGAASALASAFGKSGASSTAGSAGSDAITSYYFHTGGVVGGSARVGSVPSSVFDGATRYHTGGIAGKTPDGARAAIADALKHGEVPAILMRNEEVLRRDDPRHRANLGDTLFARIMAGEKPWTQAAAANSSTHNVVSNTANHAAAGNSFTNTSVSTLLQNIAGTPKEGGANSATVLQGLLTRMGVKDQEEPAVASAIKVAGARELGGPVSAGQLYRVNEKRPELLNVAGKQYLMMGPQGGSVDANPQSAGGQFHQTVNFYNNGPIDRRTQSQLASAAMRGGQRASARNN